MTDWHNSGLDAPDRLADWRFQLRLTNHGLETRWASPSVNIDITEAITDETERVPRRFSYDELNEILTFLLPLATLSVSKPEPLPAWLQARLAGRGRHV